LLVTPLTIEARLPKNWRERFDIHRGRVAVLVVAKPLEWPLERDEVRARKVIEKWVPRDPPAWSGIVRTEFTELRFPPPLVDRDR
jgi:hypothetical protein